jgi:hypothetical protein
VARQRSWWRSLDTVVGGVLGFVGRRRRLDEGVARLRWAQGRGRSGGCRHVGMAVGLIRGVRRNDVQGAASVVRQDGEPVRRCRARVEARGRAGSRVAVVVTGVRVERCATVARKNGKARARQSGAGRHERRRRLGNGEGSSRLRLL